MIGYVFGQAQVFNPVRELHNITVLERHSDREFTVLIPARDNPLHKQDQVEVWKLCPWGDTLDLKPGVVFPVFQYKQKAGCQLIDSDTEVKYLRDKDHNVVNRDGQILYVKGE